ncbi:Eco57I restriction-modification methylase domain-containing protein [Natronomonas gomsonensis]|uniref:Eco57I restriction-modification methylase domain-containing protein n=1 Tax=Natronomonas gomsonensis TaxID=1046043 RepID=UPI0015BC4832|nr:DNA methyltransferase [Natronomonas gomsonensis]
MTTVADLRDVLHEFLEELDEEFDDPHEIERILNGDREITRRDISAEPETWTEDILINPVLRAVGLHKTPGRPTSQRKTPDFKLEEDFNDQTLEIVGENKSLNKIEDAEDELVSDYLSNISFPNDGIATDGLDWVVYRTERGGDFFEHEAVRRHSFRDILRQLARDENIISQQALLDVEIDVDNELEAFALTFQPDHLVPLLTKTAPSEFRDRRQKDVDDFFGIYIEVLFGESDEHNYDTCLRNDIVAPDGASRKDKDVFAVTLVNRLMFIRFLEERGVLSEGFLHERVEDYSDGIPTSLYETTIKPLFYDLFNKPRSDRDLHGDWYDDVPYLNGGLFRQNLSQEDDYDVRNPSMVLVIDKLIEGNHELDLEIDPAILGSVFEMTINHISESEDRQKETGAYYTPNDVTHLINSQAVDGQVKERIVDAFAEAVDDGVESTLRSEAESESLTQILAHIEEGEGWYGSTQGLDNAKEAILDLTVLDPACGSGHFLTAAMEQLHQVLQSIHRGQHRGEDPSAEEKYHQKRDIALNSIYGVDVDRVATEIAKLRTWLKILEGNDWEESYGRLPNIDVNILEGNSLIGLPSVGYGATTLGEYSDRMDEILTQRKEYKQDNEGSKTDIDELRNDLRDDLNKEFIDRLTQTVEDEIRDASLFEELADDISPVELRQYIDSVSVKQRDDDEFTNSQIADLEDAGFDVHYLHKSAKMDIADYMEELQKQTNRNGISSQSEAAEHILEALIEFAEQDEFYYNKVVRRPVLSDLKRIEGKPFHWTAEFPEARREDDSGNYDMCFDIVVGNPPYGDILSDHGKYLVDSYETGGINDIAAQFVERELQLLKLGGHFGNITTLRIAYDQREEPARKHLTRRLEQTKMACFAHRPSRIFEGAHVKPAIVTGRLTNEHEPDIYTSRYIRFTSENRNEVLSNISYAKANGLALGEKIGDGQNRSIPKLGHETARSALEKLKDASDRVFEDALCDEETDHLMWRRRGALYWINPLFVNLYDEMDKDTPTSMYRMYFSSDLERRFSLITLQSSLFYWYWMVYKNGRNIDWWEINPFPFPDEETLEENREEIIEISNELWDAMEQRFVGKARTVIENAAELKPIVDDVDDLIGPMYGLDEEEIEYMKNFDAEYGRTPDEIESETLETYADD